MKVIELIEILRTHPPDARVIAFGYEDGFDDVIDVLAAPIAASANLLATGSDESGWLPAGTVPREWGSGEHALPSSEHPATERAILIVSRRWANWRAPNES
jgi:hypothetical protein